MAWKISLRACGAGGNLRKIQEGAFRSGERRTGAGDEAGAFGKVFGAGGGYPPLSVQRAVRTGAEQAHPAVQRRSVLRGRGAVLSGKASGGQALRLRRLFRARRRMRTEDHVGRPIAGPQDGKRGYARPRIVRQLRHARQNRGGGENSLRTGDGARACRRPPPLRRTARKDAGDGRGLRRGFRGPGAGEDSPAREGARLVRFGGDAPAKRAGGKRALRARGVFGYLHGAAERRCALCPAGAAGSFRCIVPARFPVRRVRAKRRLFLGGRRIRAAGGRVLRRALPHAARGHDGFRAGRTSVCVCGRSGSGAPAGAAV